MEDQQAIQNITNEAHKASHEIAIGYRLLLERLANMAFNNGNDANGNYSKYEIMKYELELTRKLLIQVVESENSCPIISAEKQYK